MRRYLTIALVTLIVTAVNHLWWRPIPGVGWALDPNVLLVIALGLTEGYTVALVVAAVVAGVQTWLSVVGGPVYLLSLWGAVGVTWLFSHRIVATRSTASLLATTAAASAAAVITLALSDAGMGLFDRQRLHFPVDALLVFGLIQTVLHPLVLRIVWRILGRDRYSTLSTLQRSL